MIELATWQPPTRPGQWQSAASSVLDHFLQSVARFGIRPSPDLKLVTSDSAFPYYEHATQTIYVGMPDPETGAGRLYWLFVSRLTAAADLADAIESAGVQLPFLIAHEATHHLRHHYGAPTDNDFVEEQVANSVALAYVRETEAYRQVVERISSTAATADKSLDALTGNIGSYISGFRLNLTDVLLGSSSLSAAEIDRVVSFARAIRRPVDEVLNQTLFADPAKRRRAEQLQRESQSYFNQTYLTNLATYAQFFSGWLQWYGKSGSQQTLGEVLLEHILSSDWALTRQRETLWFLHCLLNHPADELAAAAAEFLAGEPAESAVPELLLSSRRRVVRVAALRALPVGAAVKDGSVERLRQCLCSPEPAEATAATALLLAAVHSGAVDEDRDVVLGSSALGLTITAAGDDRLDALRELAARRIDIANRPELLNPVLNTLSASRASERSAAACLLAITTTDQEYAERLAPLLADADPIVRRDGLRAYTRHQSDRPKRGQALLLALTDPSEGVRDQAEAMLVGEVIDHDIDSLNLGGAGRDWDLRLRLCRIAAAGQSRQRAIEFAGVLLDELSFWQEQLHTLSLSLPIAREPGASWELVRSAVAEEELRLKVLAVQTVHALDPSPTLRLVLEGMTVDDSAAYETAVALARRAPVEEDLRVKLLALLASVPVEHRVEGTANTNELALHYPEEFLRDLVRKPSQPSQSESTEMLTATEKLVFLHSTQVFSLSPIRQLRQLADSAVVRAYSVGECIINAGATPDAVHIVASGTVRVARSDVSGDQLLGPRQSFGELELFSGRHYAFEATAAENCTLMSVPGDRLFAYATANPGVLLQWTQMLSARLLDQSTTTTADASVGVNAGHDSLRERGLSYVWQIPPDLLPPIGGESRPRPDDDSA